MEQKNPNICKTLSALQREFSCNNGAFQNVYEWDVCHEAMEPPSGRAVNNVNFLAQKLITLIAKDKEILHQNFMWLQELIRKTQP